MRNYNTQHMIAIGGVNYILDLDTFSGIVNNDDDVKTTDTETNTKYTDDGKGTVTPYESIVTIREFERAETVNTAKYDIIRMSIEILLTYSDEIDDTLGAHRAFSKTPISFKIAFNTLLNCGVLIVVDEEEEY